MFIDAPIVNAIVTHTAAFIAGMVVALFVANIHTMRGAR